MGVTKPQQVCVRHRMVSGSGSTTVMLFPGKRVSVFLWTSLLLKITVYIFIYLSLVPPTIRFPSGSPVLGIVYNEIILTFVIDNAFPSVKPSNVIWKFRSDSSQLTMTLSTGSRYSFSNDRLSLTITDLTHDDQGQYTITATNEAGTDQYFITLDIEGVCVCVCTCVCACMQACMHG